MNTPFFGNTPARVVQVAYYLSSTSFLAVTIATGISLDLTFRTSMPLCWNAPGRKKNGTLNVTVYFFRGPIRSGHLWTSNLRAEREYSERCRNEGNFDREIDQR